MFYCFNRKRRQLFSYRRYNTLSCNYVLEIIATWKLPHSLPRFAQHAVTEGNLRQTGDSCYPEIYCKCRSWLKCGRWLDLRIIVCWAWNIHFPAHFSSGEGRGASSPMSTRDTSW